MPPSDFSPHSEDSARKRRSPSPEEDEEHHHHDEEEERRTRRRNKKKKTEVFTGLSDAERRKVRQQQRQIHERLVSRGAADADEDDSDERIRAENNRLFAKKVRYTREAVLDADNCQQLASNYVKSAEAAVQVPRYDAGKLINALQKNCSGGRGSNSYFDWKTLGHEAGICFNAVPSRVSFAAGRWDQPQEIAQKKARAKRVQRVVDTAPADKPQEETAQQQQQAQQSSSSRTKKKESHADANTSQLKKMLTKRCEQELENSGDNAVVPGVNFLFNPESFTQTVENIFYYSFLVKKNHGTIACTPERGLHVLPPPLTDETPKARQAICSLTMRDWRRLVQQHFDEGQKGDMPHRRIPKEHKV